MSSRFFCIELLSYSVTTVGKGYWSASRINTDPERSPALILQHTHVWWEYFKHTGGWDGQVVHQTVSSALSHSHCARTCAFFFLSRSSVMQAAAGIMHIILNTIISIRVAVHVSRLITCNSLMRCVYGFITLKCQKNFKESISRPPVWNEAVCVAVSLSFSLSVCCSDGIITPKCPPWRISCQISTLRFNDSPHLPNKAYPLAHYWSSFTLIGPTRWNGTD